MSTLKQLSQLFVSFWTRTGWDSQFGSATICIGPIDGNEALNDIRILIAEGVKCDPDNIVIINFRRFEEPLEE